MLVAPATLGDVNTDLHVVVGILDQCHSESGWHSAANRAVHIGRDLEDAYRLLAEVTPYLRPSDRAYAARIIDVLRQLASSSQDYHLAVAFPPWRLALQCQAEAVASLEATYPPPWGGGHDEPDMRIPWEIATEDDHNRGEAH